jgi:hypothetical protein
MGAHPAKEPRTRKVRVSMKSGEPALPESEPVHGQPVSPSDDLQVRIAKQRTNSIWNEDHAPATRSAIGLRQSGRSAGLNVTPKKDRRAAMSAEEGQHLPGRATLFKAVSPSSGVRRD